MELHFAPMQGFVDNAYRRLHHEIFGGIDCYYTPFIRIEGGEPRRKDIQRLEESLDDGTPLVPQIIFNSVDEFCTLHQAVVDTGFRRIDLNLGCPFAMQTRKGRGAAMISDIDAVRQITEVISNDTDVEYSIKMRLGLQNPEEWKDIMPILNDLRLRHITLHPRTARQMYEGELFGDAAGEFIEMSANPVIWNGDIATIQDINQISAKYPKIKGVMAGRGLLARPTLASEFAEGREFPEADRHRMILDMHHQLFEIYTDTLCGPTQILQKIKPFWEYMQPHIDHKAYKKIKKSTTLAKYTEAVASVFS